jgi:long-chain acyl-CoA synthetase
VVARLARVVEVGLAKVDLTPSQYRVLCLLAAGSAQASAMADHLAVTRPSVTAVVDGLVSRGLVERRHDELDRRRVGHTITTAGVDLLEQADAVLNHGLEEVLDHAPDERTQGQARDGLRAWRTALDRYRLARQAAKAPVAP